MENNQKQCNICKKVKQITEFYATKNKKSDGSEYIYYLPYCKECNKEKNRKWAIDNPEKIAEKRRRENITRRDYISQHKKDNREMYSTFLRNWQRNNKDKVKKSIDKRKQNKTYNINSKEWDSCKKYFNYCCAYCGISEIEAKKQQGQNLHKEHVDTEGANDLSNCVPACRKCNSSKWMHKLEDWYNEANNNYTYERLEKINKWLTEDYLNYINIK